MRAAPLLALFVLAGVAFAAAAARLEPDPRLGKALAIAAALVLTGMGVLAGFGAGDVTFPAAGLGALAAWAALLHPPRRAGALAFAAYVAVGLVMTGPRLGVALAYPWQLATIFIWPVSALLQTGTAGFLLIYAPVGLGVAALVALFVRRMPGRAEPAEPTVGGCGLLVTTLFLGGTTAIAVFIAMAYLRTDTSLRFELAGSVLALLFIGGALAGFGAASSLFTRSLGSGLALGIGVTVLFFVFTYRPAVTCSRGGVSEGMPLAWALSGVSGPQESRGGGTGSAMTGTTVMGGRVLEYRCEPDRVVEYRER